MVIAWHVYVWPHLFIFIETSINTALMSSLHQQACGLDYSAFVNSCPMQTDTFLFPLIHSHNVYTAFFSLEELWWIFILLFPSLCVTPVTSPCNSCATACDSCVWPLWPLHVTVVRLPVTHVCDRCVTVWPLQVTVVRPTTAVCTHTHTI